MSGPAERRPLRKPAPPGTVRGFTLIELALAVFIIGLILGGILYPLSAQVDQRQTRETLQQLEEIHDALIGFAVANGYLPCPDTFTDGLENVTGGNCTTVAGGIAAGRLPHRNLGLGNYDLWGNRFTYVVNAAYAQRSPSTPFSLSSTGTNVRVCTTQACTTTLSTTAVFAVLSHGRNGAGAVNYLANTTNPASASPDEQDNYDTDADVVYRPQFTGSTATSEFDDIVVWLSKFLLFNRMVAAGQLP